MAGASDKARFYLEQSVPELHELVRKKIFSKQEVSSIAKRRSDFEHKLNARGSKPIDYARYAEYEINLESLRRKRVKRIGLKHTGHTGQRRIFFILDRGTRKFSGDLGLWMQYIDFAHKQKANRKLSQILTTVLRLHPTNAELWIYAAHYALDERLDIVEARNSMQRGLRFCNSSKHLWCEYTKLEMIYISTVAARGRLFEKHGSDEGNTITLPTLDIKGTDLETFDHIDKSVLAELQKTPALSGAIPIAIYNAAIKRFPQDGVLGRQLFDIVAQFQDIPCVARVLRHIVQNLQKTAPQSPSTMICFIREPVSCVKPALAIFPSALRESLGRLQRSMETLSKNSSIESDAQRRGVFACEVVNWTLGLLNHQNPELDQDVSKALMAVLKKTWNQLLVDLETSPGIDANEFARLLAALQKKKLEKFVTSGVSVALRLWPENPNLSAFRKSAVSSANSTQ